MTADLYIGSAYWQTIALPKEQLGMAWRIPWAMPIPSPPYEQGFGQVMVQPRVLIFGYRTMTGEDRAIYELIDVT
jgi:hypothetical protein